MRTDHAALSAALYEVYDHGTQPNADEWREDARAALVAAQGAAPQAAALPETGNELLDEDGGLVLSGKHLCILQQGMYVCDTCINTLGLNVRWDHAVLREAPTPLPAEGESGL